MKQIAYSMGPPIRFLILVIIGYSALRGLSLLPGASPDEVIVPVMAHGHSAPKQRESNVMTETVRSETLDLDRKKNSRNPYPMAVKPVHKFAKLTRKHHTPLALAGVPNSALQNPLPLKQDAASDPAAGAQGQRDTVAFFRKVRPSRFSGYGWAMLRSGQTDSPQLPSLGGSQTGLRLDWAWNDAFALTGRMVSTVGAAPAGGHQREAALGIAYFPFRDSALELVIERRASLGGGRSAWQLRASGGKEWSTKGLRVEVYGQVGITGLRRRDSFAEGKVSLRRPIIGQENARLALGGGAWGAAQPGASRLDLGPQVVADFKLGLPVRVSADYRLRVAGNAIPASGPVLTLSTGF